jgi:hypothetical protein
LAHNLVTPCLGHEPKARVATKTMVLNKRMYVEYLKKELKKLLVWD